MQGNLSVLFPKWADEVNTTLLKNNSLCIALLSLEGDLLFANPAMQSLFKEQQPSRNFINPTFEALIQERSEKAQIYSGYITIGDLQSVNTSIEAEVYRKKGEILIIGGIDPEKLVDQNQKLHKLNKEINNLQRQLIREKYNLEQALTQLNRANHELEELNATKDKLFSVIAHDLKNPFVVLLGFSELLVSNIEKGNKENLLQFAQNIHRSSEQTYNLLINLLDWAKLQRGKIQPIMEKVHTGRLVDEVALLLEQQLSKKGLKLITRIDFQGDVVSDREMILFLLRNLLTNAIKFSHANSEIRLTVKQNDDDVLFVISDQGVGISKKLQDRLFDIKENSSTRGTQGERGTGLGLVMCRDFVELIGGKIWVESEENKGSDFMFTIPLKKEK